MAPEPSFLVARFEHKKDVAVRRDRWTFAQLELALTTFATRSTKDGPLWSPTEYVPGGSRCSDDVASLSCLVLDFDEGLDHEDLVEHWRGMGLGFCVHSTYRHSTEAPRWRAVFPLATPVPATEWSRVYAELVRFLADGLTDPSCKDVCRIYYLPSSPPKASRFAEWIPGRLLSPDDGMPYVPQPGADPPKPAPRPRPEGVESPGDWFERNGDWGEILTAAGGRFMRMARDRQWWLRPGKEDDGRPSITTGNGRNGQDLIKVHTNAWAPFEPQEVLTKYGAYTLVHHGRGNWAAAIAAIKAMPGYPRDEGGGSRREPPDLPPGPPLRVSDLTGPAAPAEPLALEEDPADYGRYLDPDTGWRRNFALGDVGNAERFVHWFGRDLRHVAGLGWFVWDGARWRRDEEGALAARAMGMRVADRVVKQGLATEDEEARKRLYALGAQLTEKRRIDPMLSLAAALPQVEARLEDFDGDPYLLGVRNGVVDLRTGELRAPSPDDMITMRCGCDYEARPAPVFLAFLGQIMMGREDLMRFLTLSLGYSLSGCTSTRAFWFLSGSGGNGKGALVKLLGRIVGDYGTTLMPESVMVRRNDQIPADLAKLQGKRFVAIPEVNDEKRLNEALVKALSGFDEITARFLNQNFVDFTPCAKIWMSGNQRPQVRNFDRAMRQRMRVVPFDLDLSVEEQDTALPDRLWAEAPGILWLLVRAFAQYAAHGLPATEAVDEATDAYQAAADSVAEFLQEECDLSEDDSRTPRREVFKRYVAWCRDSQARPLGKQKLYLRMAELGYKVSSTLTHGYEMYEGLRMRGESDYAGGLDL